MKLQVIINYFFILLIFNQSFAQGGQGAESGSSEQNIQANFNPSPNDIYTLNSPFSAYDITNKNGSGIAEMGSRPYNQWKFEQVEANVYRLKEVKSGKYLHIQNQKLEVGDIQPNWWSAMWELEHVNSNYYRIKCRWNKYGKPIYLQNPQRNLTIGELADKNAKYGRWRVRKEESKSTVITVNLEEFTLYKYPSDGNRVFPEDISTVSEQVIWKTNVAGHIEKSIDGGRTWKAHMEKLQTICGIDKEVAWGITWAGTLKMTDGESTLRSTDRKFKTFSAIDKSNAYATDDRNDIYYTNDGGQTWTKTNGSANMISAVDQKTVWMVNAGTVFRTQNGGYTWEKVVTGAKSVSAFDYNYAWIVNTDRTIQYTNDGGKIWYKVSGNFHQVQALGGDQAHVVKSNGDLVFLYVPK